jgi:hypothetical protein
VTGASRINPPNMIARIVRPADLWNPSVTDAKHECDQAAGVTNARAFHIALRMV